MASGLLDDYRWLVGDDGAIWLDRLAELSGSSTSQVTQLRKSLSADRARLLLEQRDLRLRAKHKFEFAERMFFTRQSLEQATDQWIATAKSERFPVGRPVLDLCCGIGGDLIALSRRSQVTAIDCDATLALLAEANCRALGDKRTTIRCGDAADAPVDQCDAWHIDPDRRPQGHRTAQPAHSEPPVETIDQLRRMQGDAAVKLAPAAEVAEPWCHEAERQWLGSGRECRQQVAWFGDLARCPAHRSATVVNQCGETSDLLVGQPGTAIEIASAIGAYLYEPHAAVLAADLTGTLAQGHAMRALDPDVAYLTSDELHRDLLFDTFQVVEILAFDTRKLMAMIRRRGIGRLEVKKRCVPIDPNVIQKKLQGTGPESATLLIAPHQNRVHAILARRVHRS